MVLSSRIRLKDSKLTSDAAVGAEASQAVVVGAAEAVLDVAEVGAVAAGAEVVAGDAADGDAVEDGGVVVEAGVDGADMVDSAIRGTADTGDSLSRSSSPSSNNPSSPSRSSHSHTSCKRWEGPCLRTEEPTDCTCPVAQDSFSSLSTHLTSLRSIASTLPAACRPVAAAAAGSRIFDSPRIHRTESALHHHLAVAIDRRPLTHMFQII